MNDDDQHAATPPAAPDGPDAAEPAMDTLPAVIVGVGVGPSSFASLKRLFAESDPAIGAAYLIAVRQDLGLGVRAVVDGLAAVARLPVTLARDGKRIVHGHIYVAAPDDMIGIEDGHLRVTPAAQPIGRRGTVDTLLISIAEHAHERAVAVILGGLEAAGMAGVVATKKFGGLSIAETADRVDPASPGTSDPAGITDLHIPIERIPGEIARYAANLRQPLDQDEREARSDAIEARVTQIATILRNVTGHDFHGYKRGTFIRRIQRRMQVAQMDSIDLYLERLRADREEVQHLFQDLLIGVTQFFRDPAEFDALERELPRLFQHKAAEDQFRVWVLGCATGEEAYSIAILLREHMATLDHPPDVQIFATDLDARALNIARAGRYSETIADHIRADRLERWFVREGDTYCVAKELREMCIFSPHNIVKDAPFSRIDILSCRNLLIYLNTDLQNRVIPIFHFSLRTDGILFLGSSENITRHHKLFAAVDRKSRVFRRLGTATRIIPDFPLTPRARGADVSATSMSPATFETRLPASISRQASAVAERYAPAYVIVDAQGDVLHFSGRTGRYFEPSAGAASLNLSSLVHRDLRLDVRSALHRAVNDGRRVELAGLTLRQDDRIHGITLVVEPLSSTDVTTLVVVFQDLGTLAEGIAGERDRMSADEHVQRLEAELRVTRDRLQTTIEELESTNEELKSSNEEYQSINEELQSANEEMETSKEELQSVNEELQTVNGELSHRVSELGRTNSDLKNLLESTQIATVFLDNDLRVRNFTPASTDIFHLLETDVGRPLDHVVSRVDYPELADDVRRVLKTLVPVERAIADIGADRHYVARILPYRSVDNYISGTVVTFTDLTAVHQAEMALRESEENYRVLFESIDDGFCVVEVQFDDADRATDYRFLQTNPAFERQSGVSGALGRWMRELVPDLDEHWFEIFGRIARTGEAERFENEARPLGRWFDVYAFRVGDPADRRVAVLFHDIGERKRVEVALRENEARQAYLLALSDALRPLGDPLESRTEAMRVLGEQLGIGSAEYFEADADGETVTAVSGHARDGRPREGRFRLADFGPALHEAYEAGESFVLTDAQHDERLTARDRKMFAAIGLRACVSVPIRKEHRFVAALKVSDDRPRSWSTAEIGIVEETAQRVWAAAERARAEAALRESELRLQTLVRGVPQLVWRAATEGRWTWTSPQWTEFTGKPEQESHGLGWLETLHPEDRQAARDAWAMAPESGQFDLDVRIRRAADGSYRWFRMRATPLRDEQGGTIEWLGTSTDIDDMRTLQKRQEVLVAELQHRVRNMLTVVRSVFAQTVDNGGDLETVADHFKGRLDALARTQVIVTRSAEGLADLEGLIRDELLSVGVNGGPKLRIAGPPVALTSKTAESIGLALHELTTNAVKYGALKVAGATLEISWTVARDADDRRRLTLIWAEQGVPAVPTRPTREGFGRELIEEALPYRLGAETRLEFLGGGVRCTIAVVLPSTDEAPL